MDYMVRKIDLGRKALLPVEAARLVARIKRNTLDGKQLYALLLTGLATGMRMEELLDLRMEQLAELPAAVRPALQDYVTALETTPDGRQIQPKDSLFPHLGWYFNGGDIAITPRTLVVRFKAAATRAKLDPEKIGAGTLQRTASRILLLPGGFGTFLEMLSRVAVQ